MFENFTDFTCTVFRGFLLTYCDGLKPDEFVLCDSLGELLIVCENASVVLAIKITLSQRGPEVLPMHIVVTYKAAPGQLRAIEASARLGNVWGYLREIGLA